MKRFFIGIISIFSTFSIYSMEFTIAPLYLINESTDQVFPNNDFHIRFLNELSKATINEGIRFFTSNSTRYNPPQSVSDAIVFCRTENVDYLIYGYIIKKDQTIHGELRLLDYERREVIANFYAMDSKEREDELIKDLTNKLYRFLHETYNLQIINDTPSYIHTQFPISLGYWLPINKDWTDVMYGIVRIDTGFHVIPNDRLFIKNGKIYYISVGIDISYKLGYGRNYEAWNHGFVTSMPIILHRRMNERHELQIGMGFHYSLDLLNIKKPYENEEIILYSAVGLMCNGGWAFKFSDKTLFFIDTRFEVTFYEDPMLSFSPSMGIIIRNFSREIIRK